MAEAQVNAKMIKLVDRVWLPDWYTYLGPINHYINPTITPLRILAIENLDSGPSGKLSELLMVLPFNNESILEITDNCGGEQDRSLGSFLDLRAWDATHRFPGNALVSPLEVERNQALPGMV